MTRQQLRQAQRRLKNGYFPFPELTRWLRGYLKRHPECYAQVHAGNAIVTNIFEDTSKKYSLKEFKTLIDELQKEDTS